MEIGDNFFRKTPTFPSLPSIIRLKRVLADLAKIGYFNSLQGMSNVR